MSERSERAGFVASIIEQPADNTRRRAYADWLQEHGEEERAEFIRLQLRDYDHFLCNEFRSGAATGAESQERLRVAHPEWLDVPSDFLEGFVRDWPARYYGYGEHHVGWRDEEQQLAVAADFERGFLGCVTCYLRDWLRLCDALTRSLPITTVSLCGELDRTLLIVLSPGNGAYREVGFVNRLPHNMPQHLADDIFVPGHERAAIEWLLHAEWPQLQFALD